MLDAPQLFQSYDPGIHNTDLRETYTRLSNDKSWKDLSHIIFTPGGKKVETRIVFSWMGLLKPPNNRSIHTGTIKAEVGHAYSTAIEHVLKDPNLNGWKYIVTLEHDNSPPPDGLVKLLTRMEEHPEFSAISGLYFTKGYGGVAQIWGDPADTMFNFRPQPPMLDGGLRECNGIGMGFAVFRLGMFKDPLLRKPWFKTVANSSEGAWTQDLYFWADARKFGYRCAVDCSVKVGHWDEENEIMW